MNTSDEDRKEANRDKEIGDEKNRDNGGFSGSSAPPPGSGSGISGSPLDALGSPPRPDAPVWLQRFRDFCEEEHLRRLSAADSEKLPPEERHNRVSIRLEVDSPYAEHLSQLLASLREMEGTFWYDPDVSFSVKPAEEHGVRSLSAIFSIGKPDEERLSRLRSFFLDFISRFRFHLPSPFSPSSAAPSPSAGLPVRKPGPNGVVVDIVTYRNGRLTGPRVQSRFTYSTEGNVARRLEQKYREEPLTEAERERQKEDREKQEPRPDIRPSDQPSPADDLRDDAAKNLTKSEPTDKKSSAFKLKVVSKESERPPVPTGREADICRVRNQIEFLDKVIEDYRLAYEKILATPFHEAETEQQRHSLETAESIRSEKQAELQRLLAEAAEQQKELPEEIIEALRSWPKGRRTPPEGGRPENSEAFVSRIFKEHYQEEGGYDSRKHPRLRVVDLVNRKINPKLYGALTTHNSRYGTTSPCIFWKSDEVTQEIETANRQGYGDLSHRKAERIKKAKYRRSKKAS